MYILYPKGIINTTFVHPCGSILLIVSAPPEVKVLSGGERSNYDKF